MNYIFQTFRQIIKDIDITSIVRTIVSNVDYPINNFTYSC